MYEMNNSVSSDTSVLILAFHRISLSRPLEKLSYTSLFVNAGLSRSQPTVVTVAGETISFQLYRIL